MARLTSEDISVLDQFWNPQNKLVQSTNPTSQNIFSFIGRNFAGVPVTHEIAFQVSTVWACIDVISSALASSDWNIFQRLDKGDHDQLYDDPLQYILNVRPNPEMTAKSFKQALLVAATSWGNGYAEIVRDLSGRIAELYPIAPDRVDALRFSSGIKYRCRNDDGSEVYLDPVDMFHIRGPGITGLLGDDTVAKAVQTIALAIAAERFGEAYFGNNTQLGVVLEYPGEVNDVTYNRLKEAWESRHQGPNRAFKVGVIEAGMKVHPMNIEAQKSQLIEARKFQVEEICRWFRVPPHKVAHLDRSTFNNIEHLGLEFTRDTLRPWAREIQEESEYKLFSRRGKNRFLKIDLEWASQGDYKSRAEGHQILRNAGVLSANDILKAEGKNTIGSEGDFRIVNGTNTKLEDVGKNYQLDAKEPSKNESKVEDPAEDTVLLAKTIHNWLVQIFDRTERRLSNRLLELEKKGLSTAPAFSDARTYLSNELLEVSHTLSLWSKRDPRPALCRAVENAVTHRMKSDENVTRLMSYLE